MAKNKDRFRVAEKEIKGPYFEFSAYAKTELPPPPKKKKTFFCNDKKKCPIIEEIDSDDDFRSGCRSVNAITNSPSQYYTLRDDRTSPTYDLPPA